MPDRCPVPQLLMLLSSFSTAVACAALFFFRQDYTAELHLEGLVWV